MKKVLTIGLAALALAGGVAATSGAAQAADWNHGGGYGHESYGHESDGRGDYGHERHDRDGWRGGERWRGGYRHGWNGGCATYRTWSPYYGRYVVRNRCY